MSLPHCPELRQEVWVSALWHQKSLDKSYAWGMDRTLGKTAPSSQGQLLGGTQLQGVSK